MRSACNTFSVPCRKIYMYIYRERGTNGIYERTSFIYPRTLSCVCAEVCSRRKRLSLYNSVLYQALHSGLCEIKRLPVGVKMEICIFWLFIGLHCRDAAVTTDRHISDSLWDAFLILSGSIKMQAFWHQWIGEAQMISDCVLFTAMLLLQSGKRGFSMKFFWPSIVYSLDWHFVSKVLYLKLCGRDHRELSGPSPFGCAYTKISVLQF